MELQKEDSECYFNKIIDYNLICFLKTQFSIENSNINSSLIFGRPCVFLVRWLVCYIDDILNIKKNLYIL